MRELSAYDPGHLKPSRPVFSVIHMDQRKFQHVGWLNEAIAPGKQLRAAYRKQLLRAEARHIKTRPVTVTVTHREVNVLARKVDVMQRRRYPQIDAWMLLGETPKSIDEPEGSHLGDSPS